MDKEIKGLKCPQCGYLTEEAGTVRCPRCNKSLYSPTGCDGACGKCSRAAEGCRPAEASFNRCGTVVGKG